MTRDERIALYQADLAALFREVDAMVIFSPASDEGAFVQFSHLRTDSPLVCQVGRRGEEGIGGGLDPQQQASCKALGLDVAVGPGASPHREYEGDPHAIGEQVEQIFRMVFRAAEDYAVTSSGIVW